ncbi:thiol-disulfide oxidoreductase [Paenibacillaceae bacterium]|nr:thiol-disulfide oxidoreductase [Paenibacillaceae bacterium]
MKRAGLYNTQKLLVVVLATAVVYIALQALIEKRTAIKAGEHAPEFVLESLDGTEWRLSDYEGKGVLLNFWASWCRACVNELPLMMEASKLVDNVEVVAVNVGEQSAVVDKFADRYDLEFPILLDANGEVKQKYKITALPATLLLNKHGVIVSSLVGELDNFESIVELLKQVQPEH